MITFSSHHMPTSQSYPNIKCIILTIDKDSHINIACKIAKRTILSHLNVNSLYNEYKITIWVHFLPYKLKKFIEFARIKNLFLVHIDLR